MVNNRTICVLGMHRSGTSAIARSLNLLGVYLGKATDLKPPHSTNPKGFWEHEQIMQIQDEVLATLNRRWQTASPFSEGWLELPTMDKYRHKLVEIVERDFSGVPVWGWKDPRTCLLLPIWKEIMQKLGVAPSYLIAVRHPLDVASSLGKLDSQSKEEALRLWTLYTLSALQNTHGTHRSLVKYADLVENWRPVLQHIADIFSLPWPDDDELSKSMDAFIAPGLCHSRSDDANIAELPELVRDTYALCLRGSASQDILQTEQFKNEVDELLARYSDYAQLFGVSVAFAPPAKLQVLLPDDEIYSGANSAEVSLQLDLEWHEYEIALPAPFEGELRIQPADVAAGLEIQSITLLARSESDGDPVVLHSWCETDNLGLHIDTGIKRLRLPQSQGTYFLVFDNIDAQFHLDHVDAGRVSGNISVKIVMRGERLGAGGAWALHFLMHELEALGSDLVDSQ